jgi:hypothetical protein
LREYIPGKFSVKRKCTGAYRRKLLWKAPFRLTGRGLYGKIDGRSKRYLSSIDFSPGGRVVGLFVKEITMIEGRSFIGIGKIFIDTPAEDWNIPSLHFIVSEVDKKTYEAINLEFGLVTVGQSGMAAAQDLATLACTYILSVIRGPNGYKELRDVVRNPFMTEYWCEYRGMEFDLAETGDDLSHYLDRQINKAIKESFNDELKKALELGAKQAAAEILSLFALRPPIVEYKEICTQRSVA